MPYPIIETDRPCADDLDYVAEHGCVAHKDEPEACDGPNSPRWWCTNDTGEGVGDVWCDRAYRDHMAAMAAGEVIYRTGPGGTELYGMTGKDADWIRDNVGLD